ncbi:MAG: LpxI family protein [Alphaproteobacteria bacterium]
MSAAEEIQVKPGGVLGIIAGGGPLPEKLARACEQKNIRPFIMAFKGQTDPACIKNRNHAWLQLRTCGHVPDVLREHGIKNAVMIGSIHRPGVFELIPDAKTAKIMARVGFGTLGDNGLLSSLRAWLEEEGIHVEGIHKYTPDLLVPEGVLGKIQPAGEDWIDIRKGLQISQELGRLDVGQSVVVQAGLVLGVEGIDGTDALIKRCGKLRRKGRSGVLVKTCKPQQDRDLDLPVIGRRTVANTAKSGLIGIVVHAGNSMIIDRAAVIAAADEAGIFILGANP